MKVEPSIVYFGTKVVIPTNQVVKALLCNALLMMKGLSHGDESLCWPAVRWILLSVGERRMGNKNFPTRTKTYHGDVHLREGMSDLRTLVDRTAEVLVNAVDVVERPHVPRSAPRTIPRSVPRSSTERTAPPRSAHVQLDDDLGLLDPARETER